MAVTRTAKRPICENSSTARRVTSVAGRRAKGVRLVPAISVACPACGLRRPAWSRLHHFVGNA